MGGPHLEPGPPLVCRLLSRQVPEKGAPPALKSCRAVRGSWAAKAQLPLILLIHQFSPVSLSPVGNQFSYHSLITIHFPITSTTLIPDSVADRLGRAWITYRRKGTLMQNRRSFIATVVSTVFASRLAQARGADLDGLSWIEKVMHDFVFSA